MRKSDAVLYYSTYRFLTEGVLGWFRFLREINAIFLWYRIYVTTRKKPPLFFLKRTNEGSYFWRDKNQNLTPLWFRGTWTPDLPYILKDHALNTTGKL